MQRDQQCSAREQGNDREQGSTPDLTRPLWIWPKPQIGETSHMAEAQKRPKQEYGSDQDGAVKERVEIIFRQKREHPVRCKRLS